MSDTKSSIIEQFRFLTHANQATAQKCLSANNWHFHRALDAFFQTPEAYCKNVKIPDIEQLFKKYADPEEPAKIKSEGMIKLLQDIPLNFDDMAVLLLAWKCDAQVQCEFTFQEFLTGLARLEADSLMKLKENLAKLESKIDLRSDDFKKLYGFTFTYASEKDSIFLDVDSAIAYWHILFGKNFHNLDLLCEFLKEKSEQKVSKDLWTMVYEFATCIDDSLLNYNCTDSWPALIDEFVEWCQEGDRIVRRAEEQMEQ